MAALTADYNLLLGLIALQNGLIVQDQLLGAFRAWTLDKSRALADHLIALGHLNDAQRAVVEAMADLHVAQHGDVEKSLAAIPAGKSTRESLAKLGDPDIHATLGHVASGHGSTEDGDADRTASYAVGTATAGGQRFRVLRPHARGGLGAVFVALDEELHREVALKQILETHADDPVSRQRFLLEAAITGNLEHPGVVPVYGLGTYGDGRPYYAMRFVRGDSLKEAIDRFHADAGLKSDPGRRSLELRQLLRRFLDVCNAIEYAHSRGVLHRDIKPGNIIVGKHGETLVVDWGLAKARGRADAAESPEEGPLRPSSASGSAETLPGSALGTPAYMSPEPARGDLEHLGPGSDVYSLGATLYCLLTGRPPVEDVDVGAMLRAVQNGAFPPPRQVAAAIDRALEAVCLKAMARKPGDRYGSPRALAEDVERWMADEPVTAWRESPLRRAGRWARRHRPFVAGLAALLITAVIALSVGAVLINRERARAEESFRQARAAVDDYFTTVSQSKLLDVPGLQPLRKELLESARTYYQGFLQQRRMDSSVRAETAATHWRLAFVIREIGPQEAARAAYQQAVAHYQELVGAHPGVAKYQTDLAICYNDLASLEGAAGRTDEALRLHREALALRERVARAHPQGARYQNELAKSHANIGTLLLATGQTAEALSAYERARALNEGGLGAGATDLGFVSDLGKPFDPAAMIRRDLISNYGNIGRVLVTTGKLAEAQRALQRARELAEALVADKPGVADSLAMLAAVHQDLGSVQLQMGRSAEALKAHERARELREALVRDNPAVIGYRSGLASSFHSIGYLLAQMGKPAEALDAYRRAVAIGEELAAANPTVVGYRDLLAGSYSSLANLLDEMGRTEEALRNQQKVREIYEVLAANNPTIVRFHAELARSANNIGYLLTGAGRPAEALRWLERGRTIRATLAADHPDDVGFGIGLARSDYYLGRVPREPGGQAEALSALRRAEETYAGIPDLAAEDRFNLACILALRAGLVGPGKGQLTLEQEAERRRVADSAMDALRRAVAHGYKNLNQLKREKDLNSLRSRADFRDLLHRLEAGADAGKERGQGGAKAVPSGSQAPR